MTEKKRSKLLQRSIWGIVKSMNDCDCKRTDVISKTPADNIVFELARQTTEDSRFSLSLLNPG